MYYKEELEKDTRYRAEYSSTLDEFLFEEHEKAKEKRKFMTPEQYASDTEKYRKMFIEFLGFPLNKERNMPKLLEKKFVV